MDHVDPDARTGGKNETAPLEAAEHSAAAKLPAEGAVEPSRDSAGTPVSPRKPNGEKGTMRTAAQVAACVWEQKGRPAWAGLTAWGGNLFSRCERGVRSAWLTTAAWCAEVLRAALQWFRRWYIGSLTAEWPAFSKLDTIGLARFVSPDAAQWIPLGPSRFVLRDQPDEQIAVARAVYEALRNVKPPISYTYELYDPSRARQPIRAPGEIVEILHEGTCLDLAALFCGVCLGNDLLPVLIVVRGHALAAVWTGQNRTIKQWNSRPEYRTLMAGPIKKIADVDELGTWIQKGLLIPVECTGFALAPRVGDGFLTFDEAVAEGRKVILDPERPLEYALDIAIAHYGWRIEPYPLRRVVGERGLEVARLRSQGAIATIAGASLLVLGWIGWSSADRYQAFDLERKLVEENRLLEPRDFLEAVETYGDSVRSVVRSRLLSRLDTDLMLRKVAREPTRHARQRSRAALGLWALGDTSGLLRVLDSGDVCYQPQSRAWTIEDIASSGVPISTLVELLERKPKSDSVRQGLLLAIGEYDSEQVSDPNVGKAVRDKVASLFEADPDPGVHAAADWLLRTRLDRLGGEVHARTLLRIPKGIERLKGKDRLKRQWYIDGNTALTMIYFPGGKRFDMGDLDERRNEGDSSGSTWDSPIPHVESVSLPFALSATEVPLALLFSTERKIGPNESKEFPANFIGWDAATNLLNTFNAPGVANVYVNRSKNKNLLLMAPRLLDARTGGYRLPSEAEWEYASRGNSLARFCYGSDERQISRYGVVGGARSRCASRRPNDFGLFDVHGGVAEWCNDAPYAYTGGIRPPEDAVSTDRIVRGGSYHNNATNPRFLYPLFLYTRMGFVHREGTDEVGFRVAQTVDPDALGMR
jgi:Sulfatase-modifying factor enzyme 1